MKKIFKFLLWMFIIAVVLLAGTLITLRIMFPMEKIKVQIQQQVKNKFNREIDFKDVSLSLKGLSIKDFALSEKNTFKDGTFISAGYAHAEVDFKALLHKQIKIQNIGLEQMTVNIIKYKDGKFNFDDLISKQEESSAVQTQTEKESSAVDISAEHLYTKEASINYSDEETQTKFSLDNLNIQIDNFDLNKDFSVLITCLSKINMPNLVLDPVLFKIDSKINLASLEMSKAKAEITDFSITYDKSALSFSGLIADFSNPQVNLSGTLSGIDNNLVKHFTSEEVTPFSVPLINMILSAKLNLENNTADISQAKASVGNSFIKTRGQVDFSKADTVYNSDTELSVSLDEVSSIAKETLDAFNLKGTITGKLNLSQNKDFNIKGNINVKNLVAKLMKQDLQDVTGTITIKSHKDIYTNKWTGLLSSSPCNLTLAYKKEKNTSLDLVFYMKKFTLEDINFEKLFETKTKDKEEVKEETAAQTNKAQNQNVERYNLKADITIDQIENNVLTANDFNLKADIKDFDPSFEKAQGTLSFTTKNDEIRDIDKLMATSKIMRVMFTSLKIVQKAFDFAKLDNTNITNGIIKCDIINAQYNIKDGIVDIVKSDIDSDLTVVRATGKTDLLKDAIDVKIQAQIGKTGSKGFKPLVIKVKGPLSDPSYKLDVLSSIASIMSNSGNEVEENSDSKEKEKINTAENVVKTIGSLFKK